MFMKRYLVNICLLLSAFIYIMINPFGRISRVKAENLSDVIGEIELGKSKEVSGLSFEREKYLKFVPNEDAEYVFYCDKENRVAFRIYTYENNRFESTGTSMSYVYSTYKKTEKLNAGKTYYIGLKISDNSFDTSKKIKIYSNYSYYDINNYSFRLSNTYYTNGSNGFLRPSVVPADVPDGFPYQLTYGKECKIMGFCTEEMYDNHLNDSSINKESIKWYNDIPKENGSYYVWIKGIYPYFGDSYKYFHLKNYINPKYIYTEELKSSEAVYSIKINQTKYLTLRPEKTGDYSISVDLTDDFSYGASGTYMRADSMIYGSDGEIIYGSDVNLKGGEVYYLRIATCISETPRYSFDDQDADKEVKSPVDVRVSIPGYNYKAPEDNTNNTPIEKNKAVNNPKNNNVPNNQNSSNASNAALKKGKTFTVNKVKYKVTESKKGNYQVSVLKNQNKKIKKINVLDSVNYKGVVYKVTSIGAKAYAGSSKATSITIGSNIKSIGKNAFDGCKKIKKVIVKSKVLKTVGKNAFKNVPKNAVFSVPKSVLKKYKKLFKNYKLKVLPEFKTVSSDSKVLGALFDDQYKLNCVDYLLYKGIPLSVNDLSLSVFDQYTARTFTTDAIYLFSTYDESSKTYGDYIDTFAGTPGKYRVKAVKDVSGEYEFGDNAICDFDVYDVSDISNLKMKESYNTTYYWGTPISEKDLGVKLEFTYENKEKGLSIKINPDVRYQYKEWDMDKRTYHEIKDGLPNTGGDYRVIVLGQGTYKGRETFDLTIRDGLNISSGMYKIKGYKDYSPTPFAYTGKPLEPEKISIYTENYMRNYSEYKGYEKYLEYGKDYEIIGYISAVPEAYSNYFEYKGYFDDHNYSISSRLKGYTLKKGTPTDKGDHILRVDGRGKYRGIIFVYISIYSTFNPKYIETKGNIVQTKQNIDVNGLGVNYYTIKPFETGTYAIFSSFPKNYYLSALLFDKNGNLVNSVNGKEEFALRSITYDFYGFSIIADLKGGETYYLELQTEKLYGYKKSFDILLNVEGLNCSYIRTNKTEKNTKNVTPTDNESTPLDKGKIISKGKLKYKVTSSNKNNPTVTLYKNTNKNIKSINIPSSISYKGVKYKVTSINAKAFFGNKKLSKVTIPSSIKSIGVNAFKGIKKDAVFKVPKKKVSYYKKLLKKAKIAKTVKVKSY